MPSVLLQFIILFTSADVALGSVFSYKDSQSFSSDDFLFRENSERRDRSFTNYTIVDAELDLGISSGGCGQINIHKTLKSSLKGLLDEKYFQQMGSDLAGSSFMLLTCYWSPQICSILKSSRINASLLGRLRYSQCNAINRYTDSRVEDWEIARQNCFSKALNETGGDADKAMGRCGKNSFNYNLADWAGESPSGEVSANKLIESSARWMGLKGSEAKRVIDITKAFVGDSVLSKGKFSVDFGSRRRALTPRVFYQEQRKLVEGKLKKFFIKADSSSMYHNISEAVTEDDLKDLNKGAERRVIGRKTLEALYRLPRMKRKLASEKLASTLAIHKLASEANKSLDLLHIAEQNPNLPKNRKEEIREKRKALKEGVETTVFLEKQKNEPINVVLKKISEEASGYKRQALKVNLKSKANQKNSEQIEESFFNCADGFMCLR